MKFTSQVRVRYLAAIASILLASLSAAALAKRSAPDISDVLQGSRPGFDLGFALVGFLALSLATLSVAKGYEIFTKTKESKNKLDDNPELMIMKEENARLMGMNSTLNYEIDLLRKDTTRLEASLRDRSGQDEIMKKNELSLRKELEKLLSEKAKLITEKEALTLKASQSSIFEMNRKPAAKIEIAPPKPAKKVINRRKLIKARTKRRGKK